MPDKDEIKREIFDLAQKISRASSSKTLMETTREMYEKAVLLKYAKDLAVTPAPAPIPEALTPVAETAKQDPQNTKQATIDLFSAETELTPTPVIPEPVAVAAPEVKQEVPAPVVSEVKPVVKEKAKPRSKEIESVVEKLQHKRIADLKAAIGINEKFQFINELFEGNMKEYNVALDQVNSSSSLDEAESYLSNLEGVYKWEPDNQVAENFKELVQRRFA